MKRSIRFSLFLAGVCAVLPVAGLRAQDTAAPAATPSVSAPAAGAPATGGDPRHAGAALNTKDDTKMGKGKGKGHMGAAMADLTPEEKQKVMAARKKAMDDPAVKEAKANKASDPKAFRRTMREAMLRADPDLKDILEKMHGGKMHKKDLKTN